MNILFIIHRYVMGKRRRVFNFHIDAINEILESILSGKIFINKATRLVNEKATNSGEQTISATTVKRLIEEILSGDDRKLEIFYENLRKNKGKGGEKRIANDVKKDILEKDLPMILSGEIQLITVAKKYDISNASVIRIIENSLKSNKEVFQEYKRIVKGNIGASLEEKQRVADRRTVIEESAIVMNVEFSELSVEEQKNMVALKFQKMRIRRNGGQGEWSAEAVNKKIDDIVKYFMNRNLLMNESDAKGRVTEFDVLYMISPRE